MGTTTTPARVFINEVATRDGLQNEKTFVPTPRKIALVDALSRTGVAKIEVTSFVSPKAIPNLRDATEVMAGITRQPGVVYTTLVPNNRGALRAIEAKVDEINLVMSIGEKHNLANMRMTCDESLAGFRDVMGTMAGSGIRVTGSIATAFGCPFEGEQPLDRVLWATETYLNLGMVGVTLCDTVGMAHPRQVGRFCRAVRDRFPGVPFTVHFHDTRGMGLANVMAALDAGIDSFDTSLGGIGGCPYAPGATGNISTEDTVHMLEACGVATGVDLDAILPLARGLTTLLGRQVGGQVARSGKRTDLHAFPQCA
ncbi:hydroxymethylglutaryl-CoA lyase [Rhodoplanes serenus]|uniref:hydroxymethylglutaryl-CoA lyase n=1 Tax=Rhodoplanes serenus TaxID=200615 RepID=UPI000DABCD8E|nr:hydroxymethylglutaryl-CoA lyase [Rhodoplanes serenus]RAI35042.1 hydroxymethylglutaryl-CoA lyase [Rhodoplanes serenus]